MSYSITFSGHTSEPHNAEVRQVAEETYRKLRALPGSYEVSLYGYSNDGTGNITLEPPQEDDGA